jgi:hypothetical protein
MKKHTSIGGDEIQFLIMVVVAEEQRSFPIMRRASLAFCHVLCHSLTYVGRSGRK